MSDENVDEEQLYWMTLLGTLDSQQKGATNVNDESLETMQSYLYLDLVQYEDQNLQTGDNSNEVDSRPSAWLVGKEINDEVKRDSATIQSNEFSGKDSSSVPDKDLYEASSYSISSYSNNKNKVSSADDDFSVFQSRFLNKEKKKNNSSLYKPVNDDTSISPPTQFSATDTNRIDETATRSEIVLLSEEEDHNKQSSTDEHNTNVWKDEYSKNLYNLMKKDMMFEELEDPSVSPLPNPPNRHSENFVPMITEEEYELNRSQTLAKKNQASTKVDFVVELPESIQESASKTAWYGKIVDYLHTAKHSLLTGTNEAPFPTHESTNSGLPKFQEVSKWASVEVRKYSHLTYQTIVMQLNEHLYMNSFFTIVREMTHNALDRTDNLTEQYITLPVSLSNQEWKYFDKISKASSGWEQLFIRYSMATIHWKQRQLLKETRDENYYQYLPLLSSNTGIADRAAVANGVGPTHSIVKDKLLALIVDSSHKQELVNRVFGDSKLIVKDGMDGGSAMEGNDEADHSESKNQLQFISTEERESFFPTIKELVQLELSSSNTDQASEQNDVFEPMNEYSMEDMHQIQMQNYLVKYFTPPAFQLNTECFMCQNPFSVTCFRHHCRYCGRSVCSDHSRQKRRLLRFGIIPRVRVCDQCIERVDERHMYDELLWKDGRLTAYLANELISYVSSSSNIGGWDSDKGNSFLSILKTTANNTTGNSLLNSIVQGTASKTTQAISFAKLAFSQYSAKLLPSASAVKQITNPLFSTYIEGLKTSFAMEERNNSPVFQSLNFLRHSFRLDQLFMSMPPSDSMFLLYLKLLLDESMIAEYPNYFQIVNRAEKNGDQTKEKNINYELTTAVKYASLALLVIYQGNAHDMQRLAKLQGLDLIFTNIETNYDDYEIHLTDSMSVVRKSIYACLRKKPIYALFGTSTSSTSNSMYQQAGSSTGIPRVYNRKEIIFVIRGDEWMEKRLLLNVHEYDQDFHNVPILFPPSKETILGIMSGQNISIEELIITLQKKQEMYDNHHEVNEDIHEECYCFASYEMTVFALWTLKEIGPSITRLLSSFHQNENTASSGKGYEISFVGHGLGGSIATLLTIMLHSIWDTLQDITAFDATKGQSEDTMKRIPHPGHLQCISYGALACLSAPAAFLLPTIYSIILQNDLFVSLSFSLTRRYFHAEMTSFHANIFAPLLTSSSGEFHVLAGVSNEEEFWFKLLQQMLKMSPFYSRFALLCNGNDSNSQHGTNGVQKSVAKKLSTLKDSSDDDDDMILIGEPLPVLTVPGKVLYLYETMGQWRVSTTSTFFQHLLLNRNMLVHHVPRDIFHALLECRAQYYSQSAHTPPYWTTLFSINHCSCCKRRFEWPSSAREEVLMPDVSDPKNAETIASSVSRTEENRSGNDLCERYHCYHCGEMVCGNCNRTSVSIPKFAMIFPKHICDTCVLSSEYAQM